MPIEEAAEFFAAVPAISRHMNTLTEVGLGYVRLGQPAPTLSGGEAQRVKLATELQKRSTGRTVYVLDEPTTGLHFEDIRKLLGVLQGLVDKGNTVIVIEHNLDVIKSADFIVDLGPEGGNKGGSVVVTGTPEEVATHPESHTGRFLAPVLAKTSRTPTRGKITKSATKPATVTKSAKTKTSTTKATKSAKPAKSTTSKRTAAARSASSSPTSATARTTTKPTVKKATTAKAPTQATAAKASAPKAKMSPRKSA
jgi:excinuclease ABC subunit A